MCIFLFKHLKLVYLGCGLFISCLFVWHIFDYGFMW